MEKSHSCRNISTNVRGLYLITDEGDRLVERVREALSGGVSILQYRNKDMSCTSRKGLGLELKQLCHAAGVPFIVNDDLDLALALDADGVHLGQDDGDPVLARRLLPGKIIGISTHDLDEARRAETRGADYIGFGAMYPTSSKNVTRLPGPEGLPAIKSGVGIPVVAIGGIHRDNAAEVVDRGADAIAVISAVLGSSKPAVAAAELSLLFNRRLSSPRGTVLTVAGSDSGGGAGIQADLKTITLLGSYGASVITALTAQNTCGVRGIHAPPASFVLEQLDAVLADLPVHVVKTGMLFSAEIVSRVATRLLERPTLLTVVDPVMVAKGGASLMERKSVEAMKRELLPVTYLLTPNVPEAEQLLGQEIRTVEDVKMAARALWEMGAANVLIKGGHLTTEDAVDILYDGNTFISFSSPRIPATNTHGTGCTLASAIATLLAQGQPLPQAVAGAKEYVTTAITLAVPLGKGHGPVNHFMAAKHR